jgi:nitrite reductase/ring-hydroxylating ferredoxin subunit
MNQSENAQADNFTFVCAYADLKENSGKRFYINEVDIAIFKIAGSVYALNNVCPHQHSAMIYDGFIEHGCVVCPSHGWMFDLQTGKMPDGSRGLDAYQTKIIDERVYVKVVKKEFKW